MWKDSKPQFSKFDKNSIKPSTRNSRQKYAFIVTDVPDDFPPNSFVARLTDLAYVKGWCKPKFSALLSRNGFGQVNVVGCVSLILDNGESYEFTSYASKEFKDAREATEYVASTAFRAIAQKRAVHYRETAEQPLIIRRVAEMVRGSSYGIWAFKIIADYEKKYSETLPNDFHELLVQSNVFDVTKVSDKQFIVSLKRTLNTGRGTQISRVYNTPGN